MKKDTTEIGRLRLLAVELRMQILSLIYSAQSGHTGGSLSLLDILVSLYFHTLRYDPTCPAAAWRDRFILSKGHSVEGLYCVLARAGFFPESELASYGKFGSRLFGHPTMKIPGVEIPSGSLGHGLAVGVGMAIAGKREHSDYRVYVLMGDGEQAEGSIWEAAMSASHYGLDNLVGIIDYNKLQISGDVDTVMRISSLSERWRSFGWNIHEVDGNDVAALNDVFDRLPAERGAPNLVIAHTKKGRGVSFIENQVSWHHRVPSEDELNKALGELELKRRKLIGSPEREEISPATDGGPPGFAGASTAASLFTSPSTSPSCAGERFADESTKRPLKRPAVPCRGQGPQQGEYLINTDRSPASKSPASKSASCRHVFSATLLVHAREDPNIFTVTSDARGSVTLYDFAKRLPEQFVEVGIAEQNAVGVAAGLARSGKHPFVCGPASFYSTRSFEQIKNDVAYASANVKIVGVSGGVSYGALGSTHHALHDIAALRAVPNIAIILPCDARQTEEVTAFLAGYEGPVYIRMGRSAVPAVYKQTDHSFDFGRARKLADGEDCTIVAAGETVYHAVAASQRLAATGIGCLVLDMPTIKPLDRSMLIESARKTGAVVTVEEHSIHGGLGAAVSEALSQECPVPMKIIGFPDEFTPAGNSHELFDYYGLNESSIADEVRALLKRRSPLTGRHQDGSQ